ncbi:MAG: DUF3551 domain-containing protein [Xanthobacteraceae bacterium]
MARRLFAIALLGLTGAGGLLPAHAQQHINYPWCTSGAGNEFGAVNCGFSTFEQCLATASGNGQSCGPNPFYEPPAVKPRAAVKRLRHIKNTSR